ncbi:hypothetical protein RB195_013555 [Necator americanus]|uniref:Mitochondrial import receptor subunit TOM20 homolog n=2 Tax=Necator americanus TaxID=51031 RepID=W2TMU0_NECAM|nr:import receptor subunit [Necator americanus]ETN83420.1 import receptor subunit [Necator americanus]
MSDTIFGFNKSHVIMAAGLAGAAFIGYCIYFDHARRSAPDYKEKIRRNRREKAKARAGGAGLGRGGGGAGSTQVPDPSDPSAMQAYFLQEVQLGEEFMASGNVEEGAIHIANAIALCGPSQQLLQIFQQTLPAEQYAAVIEQLPHTRARLAAMFGEAAEAAESQPPVMAYMGDGPPPPQVEEIKDLLDDTDDLE